MKPHDFLNMFKASFLDLIKNPIIILPALIFFLFLYLFSYLTNAVKNLLATSLANAIWFIFFLIVLVAFSSFVSASLIAMSNEAVKGRAKISSIIIYGKRFFFRNYALVGMYIAVYGIINYLSLYIARQIGQFFNLQLNAALVLFIALYFIGIAGILIFLTFSSFYLVLKNLPILESIKRSIKFVKSNYAEVLTAGILLYILDYFIGYLGQISHLTAQIISILLIPYLFILLARLFLKADKQNDIPAKR